MCVCVSECECAHMCTHLYKHEMGLLVQLMPTLEVWAVAGPDTPSEGYA